VCTHQITGEEQEKKSSRDHLLREFEKNLNFFLIYPTTLNIPNSLPYLFIEKLDHPFIVD